MKFKKSTFEESFPDAWLRNARELAAVRSDWEVIQQKDKIEAKYKPSQNRQYSLELFQTQKYILNAVCSCPDFKQDRGCVHIPAVLYLLNPPTEGLISMRNPVRFSFEQVLEMVTSDELFDFIRYYVPANVQFKNQFRQFFEYKLAGDEQLFSEYLDKYARVVIKNDGSKNKKAIYDIENIFNIHLYRCDRLLENEEFVESFMVLRGLFLHALKLESAVNFSIFNNNFYVQAHKILNVYLNMKLAPSFYRQIIQLFFDLIRQDAYNYFKKYNAVEFLVSHAFPDRHAEIKKIFLDKLQENDVRNKGAWLYYAIYYTEYKKDVKFLNVLQGNLQDDFFLSAVLTFIQESKTLHASPTREIIKAVGSRNFANCSEALLNQFSNFLILSENRQLYTELFKYLMNSGKWADSSILKIIQFDEARKQKQWVESLLQIFTSENEFEPSSLFLMILMLNEEYSRAGLFICQYLNMEGLVRYFPILTRQQITISDEDIVHIVDQFLTSHLGDKSYVSVEKLLKEMLFNSFPDKVKLIKSHIVKSYSDRKELISRIQSY